jgi:signal transduction histidine kinase
MMSGTPPGAAALQAAFVAALTQAILVGAAAAGVAAVLASLAVTAIIARPVRQIAAATQRIAAGHYAERVDLTRLAPNDDLGQLARSFNVMTTALESTEQRRVELLGDVAHELRTPISTLEGYLEGLLDGVIAPTPETWARLHDEAGRLHRLVTDLQDLSRVEARQLSLTLEAVAPAPLAEAALDRVRPVFAEKGLDLAAEIPATLPPIRADRDRVVQVLTNLLTNALRYTPAPGQVTLILSRAAGSGELLFQVTDTGIGLAPEQLPHVFERFYRVDKSRSRAAGGSGIGLTIARALVEAMGGRIWATSAGPGQGSTFAFTLPVARGD